MKRYQLINHLIKKYNFKTYLEIGVKYGGCFNKIQCASKLSVDPNVKSVATVKVESDTFFVKNKSTFDIIFIDGLHLEHQVDKDIVNSLNILNNNGIIVLHDCNPLKEKLQLENSRGDWLGTVWRSFVKLRSLRTDLEMFVVDTDYGCGIIKCGSQKIITIPTAFTYNDLAQNRVNWLNLISVNDFLIKYGK